MDESENEMEMTIPTTQSRGKNKMRSCIHSLKKDDVHTLHVQYILYSGTVLSTRGMKVSKHTDISV